MVSLRVITRGAVTRFVPGAVLGVGLYMLAFGPRMLRALGAHELRQVGFTIVVLTAGYVLALVAARRKLRPDADVPGRKSILAGLCAVGALGGALPRLQPQSVPELVWIVAGAGTAVTIALYFPWLSTSAAGVDRPLEIRG